MLQRFPQQRFRGGRRAAPDRSQGSRELLLRPPAGTKPRTGPSSRAAGSTRSESSTRPTGRFEVRAAFPATVQRGLQSALWLWPDNPLKYGPWPGSGEIDTADYYTARPGSWSRHCTTTSTHADGHQEGHQLAAGRVLPLQHPEPVSTTTRWSGTRPSFHLLRRHPLPFDHWRPSLISAPAPFKHAVSRGTHGSARCRGNDELLPAGTTELPATTRIDWVRAWRVALERVIRFRARNRPGSLSGGVSATLAEPLCVPDCAQLMSIAPPAKRAARPDGPTRGLESPSQTRDPLAPMSLA